MTKKQVNRKDPITASILIKVCEKKLSSNLLTDIRDLAFMLLSFACFLRFDEVALIKMKHLKYFENHVEIIILKK